MINEINDSPKADIKLDEVKKFNFENNFALSAKSHEVQTNQENLNSDYSDTKSYN